MSLRLYDAHNHLQDDRLAPYRAEIIAAVQSSGIARMVVNGACESDWPEVLTLATAHSCVLPSFGYHPWYIAERTPHWRERLVECLEAVPSAIGEIGLDRWKPGLDYAGQEEVFVWQFQLAAERNLPASIHCLQAWGRLFDLLRAEPRPARGFLLHSYGGPAEMVVPLAKLGAYFSFPGYYAHERKTRQREAFRLVPRERLLIETDAPDQSLPESRVQFPLPPDANGKPLNHPANLGAVYEFAADLVGEKLEVLAVQVEENFHRLFGF